MKRSPNSHWARTVAVTGIIGGLAALFLGLPSRGQQPTPGQPGAPSAQVVAPPAVVRGTNTPVTLDFTLPANGRLVRQPRLRVIDAKDELVELLPTFLNQQPATSGFRDLHTENYLPGTYRLRAEVDFTTPGGPEVTVASPWVTFVVPE
jgi:hypothetical protein